jgi:hypothetical protein
MLIAELASPMYQLFNGSPQLLLSSERSTLLCFQPSIERIRPLDAVHRSPLVFLPNTHHHR